MTRDEIKQDKRIKHNNICDLRAREQSEWSPTVIHTGGMNI
jgi:hypothetical protein